MVVKKKTAKKRGRPATGTTPKRYFRMSDDDYQIVEAAASERDTTTSDFIRETILDKARRIIRKQNNGRVES